MRHLFNILLHFRVFACSNGYIMTTNWIRGGAVIALKWPFNSTRSQNMCKNGYISCLSVDFSADERGRAVE